MYSGRKSVYYSRAQSYSRSYNAMRAEENERFPLIRAAGYIGISVLSFKRGLAASGINSTEWHHVGKYAVRVYYYDVSDTSDIMNSVSFWQAARTVVNAEKVDLIINYITSKYGTA